MQHIGVIARAVTEAATNGETINGDVRWLLVQFSDWLHVVLLVCFRGDKQVCSSLLFSSMRARQQLSCLVLRPPNGPYAHPQDNIHLT